LDVICAKTNRHFRGVEAIRDCASSHERCEYCLYAEARTPLSSPQSEAIVLSSNEIEELMADIDLRLKERAQQRDAQKIELSQCPQCKKQALMLNWHTDRYECLACKESFNRVLVDRDRRLLEEQREALDGNTGSKAWSGNQVWNEKKKRWEIGFKSRQTGVFNWLWIIVPLIFLLATLVGTAILNYFHPGSRFAIFGW
jgi:hypothetical protein